MTTTLLKTIVFRIFGNVPIYLRGDIPVGWKSYPDGEWVLVRVVNVETAKQRGVEGATLHLEILGGSPAGQVVVWWWSKQRCRMAAVKTLGFSRKRSPDAKVVYPYESHIQFAGLAFLAFIDPVLAREEVRFSTIDITSTLEGYNRELIKKRKRPRGPLDCPMHLPRAVKCHHCLYGQDKCALACGLRTLEPGLCPGCKATKLIEVGLKLCSECKGKQNG